MQCQLRLHLITSTEAVHKLVYRCGIVTLTEILRVPAVGRNRRW